MSQSLPYLRQEFLTAQSANVQSVSGATDTSQAFEQSLQSALLKLSSERRAGQLRRGGAPSGSEIHGRRVPSPAGDTPALPPCALAIVSTIARPSPLPLRLRASSARLKRSKARGRESVGETEPLVGDVQLDPVAFRSERSVTAPAPWTRAFSTRFPSACSTRCGSASNGTSPSSTSIRRPSSSARAEKRSATTARSSLEPSGSGSIGRPPCSDAREQEQIGGERAQTVRLLGGRAERIFELGARPGMAERQLELGLQQRERRPQLMARVGNEPPLVLECGLQPLQHVVQRLGEPLRPRPWPRRDRQTAPGRRGGDLGGLPAHLLDRAQRRAREHVAGERREQERERRGHEQLPPEVLERLVARVERAADDKRTLRAVGVLGNREQAPPSAAPGERRARPQRPSRATRRASLALSSGGMPAGCEMTTAPSGRAPVRG